LLEGAVNWMLAQPSRPSAASRYRHRSALGRDGGDSRLAWCYGDLGVASALFQASERAKRIDWRLEALALLDRCAARPVHTCRVMDASLCHGAFGVAHIFNRMYQTEGSIKWKLTAETWYKRGLRMTNLSAGAFAAKEPDSSSTKLGHRIDASCLLGRVGTALAILSAIFPVAPDWDRGMLLSGRPAPADAVPGGGG
jgi:lantibiotic biosynthesis protein